MNAAALGRAAWRRTRWIGVAAGAASAVVVVPVLVQWGQHRWLIGTGHAIAAMVVLTWTVAGFATGAVARRLDDRPDEASATTLFAVGAGTFTIWVLMIVFPLQNYRGGDTSVPVAEGAEAITATAAVVSLLVVTASTALARSSGRSRRRSRVLTRATAAVALALSVSAPLALESARDEARSWTSLLTARDLIWVANHMVDAALQPVLASAQPPSTGFPPGFDPFAGYTDANGTPVAFEPGGATRVVGLTSPKGSIPPAVYINSPQSRYVLGDVYSSPETKTTHGSFVLDSLALPNGDIFAAACSEGAEKNVAAFLGYASAPWDSGFCDGAVHVFTVHTVGLGGREAQVSMIGRFSLPLFCGEPKITTSLSIADDTATWGKTSTSAPCLSTLANVWHDYSSRQAELARASRWATGTRDAAVLLTLLLASAAAPSISALRGRMRLPAHGRGPGGRTGRPAALDASHGWAAGLVAAAADAIDDPGLTARFLEEWRADLAEFDKAWRRLLYALGVRLFAPRRLRAARRLSAADPEAPQ